MARKPKNNLLVLLSAFAALMALPGCGGYVAQQQDKDYDYQPNATVHVAQKAGEVNDANPVDPNADPMVQSDPGENMGDPLTNAPKGAKGDDDEDPMTRGSQTTATDPLTDDGNGQGASFVKHRYWLRGTIENGAMDVTVNSTKLGRYFVTVDTEISSSLHPGENTIEFQTISSGGPVTAHLSVVVSEAAPGTPPALAYDTAAAVIAPVSPVSGAKAQSAAVPLPTVNAFDSSSTTDYRTFEAE